MPENFEPGSACALASIVWPCVMLADQRSGTSKATRTVERSSIVVIAVVVLTRSPTEMSVRPTTPAKGALMQPPADGDLRDAHLILGKLRGHLRVGERHA